MGAVRKTISITPEQERWIDEHHISLSAIVQQNLKRQMGENDPRGIRRADIERSIRKFFTVLVLGMSALLLGLMAPTVAEAEPVISGLVAVVGAATIAYGFRGLRVWQERLARI